MKEQLEQLVKQGLSTYKIAIRLGKSQTTIRYWLNKFGIKTNPRQAQKATKTPEGTFKLCPKCNISKELFQNFYVRPDNRFHCWCKQCNDRITIEKQRERKQIAVNYKGGKCIICNYNKYIGALEFHHLDPTKKDFSISNIKSYSLESIKDELDKCVCLCANCHREVHAGLINLSLFVDSSRRGELNPISTQI